MSAFRYLCVYICICVCVCECVCVCIYVCMEIYANYVYILIYKCSYILICISPVHHYECVCARIYLWLYVPMHVNMNDNKYIQRGYINKDKHPFTSNFSDRLGAMIRQLGLDNSSRSRGLYGRSYWLGNKSRGLV